uniref:Uncharacterized protein n=1 Tax=Strombidinopsis acuminata TaxID=141414 RepID=A0A7S3RIW7_9SPIT|mmetsp:Transcript_17893/g.53962  ORF Transcript_17893/g.53962 Transcript_17893/m.53962 type:complete len:129 (-) Transcript_17893:48-434(-)
MCQNDHSVGELGIHAELASTLECQRNYVGGPLVEAHAFSICMLTLIIRGIPVPVFCVHAFAQIPLVQPLLVTHPFSLKHKIVLRRRPSTLEWRVTVQHVRQCTYELPMLLLLWGRPGLTPPLVSQLEP